MERTYRWIAPEWAAVLRLLAFWAPGLGLLALIVLTVLFDASPRLAGLAAVGFWNTSLASVTFAEQQLVRERGREPVPIFVTAGLVALVGMAVISGIYAIARMFTALGSFD